ncbi:MAG: NADH-quinone oxidoreductase subunit NuoK [Elusimicrobia bacterium]|nr:NADH-quinone oxidoreductase subunit NuoK [Elusimicrobiota bacterium]
MSSSAWVWSVSSLLFLSGMFCLVWRRQLLAMVLGLELLINAANLNFIYYSGVWKDAQGLAVALLVIAVAAAEVVVGFALVITLSARGRPAETDWLRDLEG